jgi:hypothetical protein
MDKATNIDYEKLVQNYRDNLEVQTRGFSPGAQWLEMWVPDEDVIASLRNLVEAAHLAKMDGLEIRILKATVGNDGVGKLHHGLDHLGELSVEIETSHYLLRLRQMKKAAQFTNIREAYRHALWIRSGHEKHHKLPSANGDTRILSHALPGGTWSLLVKGAQAEVVAASFQVDKAAGPALSAAMDLLCEIVVALPLFEVREHAVIRLEYRLRDPRIRSNVVGIILPRNADPLFQTAQEFVAGIWEKSGLSAQKIGINFFDPGPSEKWKKMKPTDREQACQKVCDARSEHLLGYAGGIKVVDAHKDYSITIRYNGDAPVAVKRKATLEVEKAIRKECDKRLEVFNIELKDENILRRLKK